MKNKSLHNLHELLQHELIDVADFPKLETVVNEFSVAITQDMHQLIDPTNKEDPIAKQFVPTIAELNVTPAERLDPIGDETYTQVKGIVHRYPDRCLFTPVHVCPVYCRFCFRKEKVGTNTLTLTPAELTQAYAYIENHSELWEVIITGGDPFILKPAVLKKILARLAAISHIEVIRIHTRIPVVDSARINDAMVQALKCDKTVYVVLHANHPNEFTAAAIKACRLLIDAGIPMLSQTILLKNINDDIEVLSLLMRTFIKNRIKPYYLHHGDLVKGTEHFRTTIETGQKLMKQLRGRFSGICQPTYVLDIPGGHGKMPIGPNYIEFSDQENELPHYLIEDFNGNIHRY